MPTIVTQINERNMAITTPCPAELVEAQSLQELVDQFGEEIVFGWAAAQAVIAFRSTVRTKASAKDKETGEHLYDAEAIANGDCLAGTKEYPRWEDWMPSVRKAKSPVDALTETILKFKTPEAAIQALSGLGFAIPEENIRSIFANAEQAE